MHCGDTVASSRALALRRLDAPEVSVLEKGKRTANELAWNRQSEYVVTLHGGGRRAAMVCAESPLRRWPRWCVFRTEKSPRHGRKACVVDEPFSVFVSDDIWLILPVVICLSQRLSHACVSTDCTDGETANGSLDQLWFLRSYNPTWITVAIP